MFGVAMRWHGRRVYYYREQRPRLGPARELSRLAELVRRFGTWHEPIPRLLTAARPQDVLRHDVAELAARLPSPTRGGRAALADAAHPMAPNLGQGACRGLEDAAVISRLAAGPDAVAGMLDRLREDGAHHRRRALVNVSPP